MSVWLFSSSCTAEPVDPTDGLFLVSATVESTPVPSNDDAADDPAIWVNPRNPMHSRVLGTDKRGGLQILDLNGQELEYLPLGRINNVDLRSNPHQNNNTWIIATRREPSQLVLLSLDHSSTEVALLQQFDLQLETPYGVCAAVIDAKFYAIANDKDGAFHQYIIDQEMQLSLVRSWKTKTQPEGCVVDDENEVIYLGEEESAIWFLDADPAEEPSLKLFAQVGSGKLVADIEGLTLYQTQEQTLLIASSQGSNSYSVFDTVDASFIGAFRIVENTLDRKIDGTSDTDGIAVSSQTLPGFEGGLFVVQDGENTDTLENESRSENQNFKFVPWQTISRALGL